MRLLLLNLYVEIDSERFDTASSANTGCIFSLYL